MKKIIIGLIISLFFVSCDKDFLTIPNQNTFSTEIFWESPENATQALYACYSGLLFEGVYCQWYDLSMEMRSDLCWNESAWRDYANYSKFNYPNYNWEAIFYIWRDHYRAIFMCNNFLKYAPNIVMEKAQKDRYFAEVKYLRALYYFNMMTYYGTPPLILEPLNGTEKPSNSTPEAIYKQILVDLSDESIAALLRKKDLIKAEYGRATIGAALTLRAKAEMQFHDYESAGKDLSIIINDQKDYKLVDNYNDNFKKESEFNDESIFEICFSDANRGDWPDYQTPKSPTGSMRAMYFAPRTAGGVSIGGYSDAQPNLFYLNEFTEKTANGSPDPRKDMSIFWNSKQKLYDKSFRQCGGSIDTTAGKKLAIWSMKYSNGYWRDYEDAYSPINQRLFRYADVLLMYAECLNETGKTALAYQYIDQVRERPSVNVIPLSVEKPNLTQDQMRIQIEHERIVELGGESWRWFDLMRYGYLDTEAGKQILLSHDYEFKNYVVGRNKYLPIPQREIDMNNNLRQNSNY